MLTGETSEAYLCLVRLKRELLNATLSQCKQRWEFVRLLYRELLGTGLLNEGEATEERKATCTLYNVTCIHGKVVWRGLTACSTTEWCKLGTVASLKPLIVVVASSIHTAVTDEQMAWTDEHSCHLCCYAVVGHWRGGLLMRDASNVLSDFCDCSKHNPWHKKHQRT